MDIYEMIRKDHNDAKAVMEKIRNMPDAQHRQRLAIFHDLKEDLIAHNDSEAASFYVALEQHSQTKSEAAHSEQEHAEAADMLEKLSNPNMPAAEWAEQFTELCSALLHHITKEESQVFTDAQRVLPQSVAERLAVTMQSLKGKRKEILKRAS